MSEEREPYILTDPNKPYRWTDETELRFKLMKAITSKTNKQISLRRKAAILDDIAYILTRIADQDGEPNL